MLAVDPVSGSLSSALVALVDKAISLIREGHSRDANTFRNCVEPLYEAVDSAHESYTKTFVEYENLIRQCSGDASWNTVFARIEQDMALTTAQRVKIAALRLRMRDPQLRPFRESVGAYIRNAAKSHQFEKYTNVPRLQLLAELEAILKPPGTRQPIQVVDRAVTVVRRRIKLLQDRYVAVTTEFESIRGSLH